MTKEKTKLESSGFALVIHVLVTHCPAFIYLERNILHRADCWLSFELSFPIWPLMYLWWSLIWTSGHCAANPLRVGISTERATRPFQLAPQMWSKLRAKYTRADSFWGSTYCLCLFQLGVKIGRPHEKFIFSLSSSLYSDTPFTKWPNCRRK